MPLLPDYALRLIFMCLAWRSCASDGRGAGRDDGGGNGTPIVAVWALPSDSSLPECGGDCEYVKAAYIKWLESAGVRSLPIPFDSTAEELKPILDGVNGLLLPGGSPPVPPGARWAIEYALALNDAGDFFPVWGTCVGWEWIAQTFVGDGPILTVDFDAENMTQPLGLLPGVAADSRMLAGFSSELLEKATTENLTANAHTKGVAPKDFATSGLDQIFRLLAVNADRQGREYVSAVEAFEYPIYGLQWHPEKAPYEWGIDPDGTPDHVINHSKDAVLLAQMLTWFFASETRRNSHSVPSISEWEPNMFHNREVTPTGPETSQKYFLYSKNDGRKRPLALQHAPAGEGAFEPVMLG